MELESGIYEIPMDWNVPLDSSSDETDEENSWTVTALIEFYEREARQY